MLKMELFLYQDNTSFFLRLVSNYVNAEKKNILKILSIKDSTKKLLNLPDLPFLVTSKNETINDEILISQLITNFAGRSEDLFGGDLERIETNLNFIKNAKKKSEEPLQFLEHLNSHLLFNTFVNGFHITVADLYAYAQTINFLVSLSEADKIKFSNILRWINHLQTLENLKETVKELKLNVSIPFEPLVFVPKEAEPKCNLKYKGENNFNAEKKVAAESAKENKPAVASQEKTPTAATEDSKDSKPVEAKELINKKEGEEKPKKGIKIFYNFSFFLSNLNKKRKSSSNKRTKKSQRNR